MHVCTWYQCNVCMYLICQPAHTRCTVHGASRSHLLELFEFWGGGGLLGGERELLLRYLCKCILQPRDIGRRRSRAQPAIGPSTVCFRHPRYVHYIDRIQVQQCYVVVSQIIDKKEGHTCQSIAVLRQSLWLSRVPDDTRLPRCQGCPFPQSITTSDGR